MPKYKSQSGSSELGVVTFALPRGSQDVYTKGATASTRAINATVPIGVQLTPDGPIVGAVLDITIWGRMVRKSDGTEVTFAASLPRDLGAATDGAMDAICGHVEQLAVVWVGYQAATDAAYARLTGQAPAKKTEARPRLVYKRSNGVSAESVQHIAAVPSPDGK